MSIPTIIEFPQFGAIRAGDHAKCPEKVSKYQLTSQSANEVVYTLMPKQGYYGVAGAPKAKNQVSLKFVRKGAGAGGNDKILIRSQITVYDSNNRPYTTNSKLEVSIPRIMDASDVGRVALGYDNIEFVQNCIGRVLYMAGASGITNFADVGVGNLSGLISAVQNADWLDTISKMMFPTIASDSH